MINLIVTTGVLICIVLILIVYFLKMYIFIRLRKRRLKSFLDLYNLSWDAVSINKFKAVSNTEFEIVNLINISIRGAILIALITICVACFKLSR